MFLLFSFSVTFSSFSCSFPFLLLSMFSFSPFFVSFWFNLSIFWSFNLLSFFLFPFFPPPLPFFPSFANFHFFIFPLICFCFPCFSFSFSFFLPCSSLFFFSPPACFPFCFSPFFLPFSSPPSPFPFFPSFFSFFSLFSFFFCFASLVLPFFSPLSPSLPSLCSFSPFLLFVLPFFFSLYCFPFFVPPFFGLLFLFLLFFLLLSHFSALLPLFCRSPLFFPLSFVFATPSLLPFSPLLLLLLSSSLFFVSRSLFVVLLPFCWFSLLPLFFPSPFFFVHPSHFFVPPLSLPFHSPPLPLFVHPPPFLSSSSPPPFFCPSLPPPFLSPPPPFVVLLSFFVSRSLFVDLLLFFFGSLSFFFPSPFFVPLPFSLFPPPFFCSLPLPFFLSPSGNVFFPLLSWFFKNWEGRSDFELPTSNFELRTPISSLKVWTSNPDFKVRCAPLLPHSLPSLPIEHRSLKSDLEVLRPQKMEHCCLKSDFEVPCSTVQKPKFELWLQTSMLEVVKSLGSGRSGWGVCMCVCFVGGKGGGYLQRVRCVCVSRRVGLCVFYIDGCVCVCVFHEGLVCVCSTLTGCVCVCFEWFLRFFLRGFVEGAFVVKVLLRRGGCWGRRRVGGERVACRKGEGKGWFLREGEEGCWGVGGLFRREGLLRVGRRAVEGEGEGCRRRRWWFCLKGRREGEGRGEEGRGEGTGSKVHSTTCSSFSSSFGQSIDHFHSTKHRRPVVVVVLLLLSSTKQFLTDLRWEGFVLLEEILDFTISSTTHRLEFAQDPFAHQSLLKPEQTDRW